MAKFIKGDVVVVIFPFSDLTETKKRPALVVAEAGSSELILSQITSQAVKDISAISLKESDFQSGSLKRDSFIRPNRLFTASDKIILYKAAHLKPEKLNLVIDSIVHIVKSA